MTEKVLCFMILFSKTQKIKKVTNRIFFSVYGYAIDFSPLQLVEILNEMPFQRTYEERSFVNIFHTSTHNIFEQKLYNQ